MSADLQIQQATGDAVESADHGGAGRLDANWSVTDTVPIGSDWTSGYYVAEFVVESGLDAGKTAWYPFVVTAPGSTSEILAEVPTNTWQAYNPWPGGTAGRSLFDFNSAEERPATKVSFNRPFARRPPGRNYYQDPVFGSEMQAVRFLEREGYGASYVSDADVDANPALLLDHGTDLVLGHDQFWTAAIRAGWDAAVADGHNAVFMGADIGAWLARYEDGGRTLVSYRYQPDPLSPRTTMFRKLNPPQPECELEGVERQGEITYPNLWDYVVEPGAASNPWIQAADLKPGDMIHAAVGYASGSVSPACATPSLEVLFHYQGTEGSDAADAVTFQTPGGARVFSSGSTMFSHLLDGYNAVTSNGQSADPRIQAFTNALLESLTGSTPASRRGNSRANNAFHIGPLKRNWRRGTATLSVYVPGPGAVEVAGHRVTKKLVTQTAEASEAAGVNGWSKVLVPIAPKSATTSLLKAEESLRLRIKVLYTPIEGETNTRGVRIRLVRRPAPGSNLRRGSGLSP